MNKLQSIGVYSLLVGAIFNLYLFITKLDKLDLAIALLFIIILRQAYED